MSNDRHKAREHALETTGVLGCAALAAVAVFPAAHAPLWLLPAAWACAGLVIALAVWSTSGRGTLALFCWWLGAALGGWTAWAELARWYDWGVIGSWILGMIVFCPWAVHAALAGTAPGPQAIEAPGADGAAEARKAEEMAQFETMFTEMGQAGVQVLDLTRERYGRQVLLKLPRSGKVTLGSLNTIAGNIEVTLEAKEGAVEFSHGANSAEIYMRIRENNVLAGVIPLRPEFRAHTITKPLAIGLQEDGTRLQIMLRELHMFLCGTTGAGKSNLINVIIAQTTSCVDTIVWVIDMKGGRTVKGWLQAWTEGNAPAPALDWVATTREEAMLMIQAFEGAITTRMNSGKGGSKITPKSDFPQIILVCDEMADLYAFNRGGRKEVPEPLWTNPMFMSRTTQAVQKARSEACTSVWATQRGTGDMGAGGALKSLCKLRFALGASSEADLRYVIPDARLNAKKLAVLATEPGTGMAAVGKKASQLSKVFYCDHIEDVCSEGGNEGCVPECPVYQASIEVGGIRPALDAMTAASLGDAYARRWERVTEQPGLARMFRSPAGAQRVAQVAEPVAAQFDEIVRGLRVIDEKDVNPIRARAREILSARGVKGASPSQLMRFLAEDGWQEGPGKDYSRETLQRWLRADEEKGILHQADYGRWKIGPREADEHAA